MNPTGDYGRAASVGTLPGAQKAQIRAQIIVKLPIHRSVAAALFWEGGWVWERHTIALNLTYSTCVCVCVCPALAAFLLQFYMRWVASQPVCAVLPALSAFLLQFYTGWWAAWLGGGGRRPGSQEFLISE